MTGGRLVRRAQSALGRGGRQLQPHSQHDREGGGLATARRLEGHEECLLAAVHHKPGSGHQLQHALSEPVRPHGHAQTGEPDHPENRQLERYKQTLY